MSFKSLKQNQAQRLEQLANEAIKQSGGAKEADNRMWKPTRDKSGNGFAVIRFLPSPAGENKPWVTWFDHAFQGPTGQWYIEKSRSTIGEDDPVGELNSRLWKESEGGGDDHPARKQARAQKRRNHFTSNILVIEDPANPTNNGKVFLYTYGKKIFEKLQDAMSPQFQDEQAFNPFDFWSGANFRLKIRMADGYPNYDKSEFDKPSELFNGDEVKLEGVYNNLYSLKEFVDPKTFKTYEELRHKLSRVLGVSNQTVQQEAEMPKTFKSKIQNNEMDEEEVREITVDVDEELKEDPVKYFQNLANKARQNMT